MPRSLVWGFYNYRWIVCKGCNVLKKPRHSALFKIPDRRRLHSAFLKAEGYCHRNTPTLPWTLNTTTHGPKAEQTLFHHRELGVAGVGSGTRRPWLQRPVPVPLHARPRCDGVLTAKLHLTITAANCWLRWRRRGA